MTRFLRGLAVALCIASAVGATAADREGDRSGPSGAILVLPARQTRVDDFLNLHGPTLRQGEDELLVAAERSTINGGATTRYQQYYRGLPVLDGQIVVTHFDGFVTTAVSSFVPGIDIATEPLVAWDKALAVIQDAIAKRSGKPVALKAEVHSLVVAKDTRARAALAYVAQVTLAGDFPQSFWGGVSARDATLLYLWDGISHFDGTSDHSYEGPIVINVSPDANVGFILKTDDNLVHTSDANNWIAQDPNSVPTLTEFSSPTPAFPPSYGVDAHYAATKTMEFLANKWSRNGWNGAGLELPVYANVNWDGAGFHYDGQFIAIGNFVTDPPPGGQLTLKSWGALDVVGHEVGHGVIHSTVPLPAPGAPIYGEPGQRRAIPEHFGDVLGTLVEFYAREGGPKPGNWLGGEEVNTTCSQPGKLVRNLADPPAACNAPDTYLDPNRWLATDVDYFEHANAGVGNKWFYLTSEGGPFTNAFGDFFEVTGLGKDTAGLIAYHSLPKILAPGEYPQYADATLSAALDLCTVNGQPLAFTQTLGTVYKAWTAVAVPVPSFFATPDPFLVPAAGAPGVDPKNVEFHFIADGAADTYTIEIATGADFAVPTLLTASDTFVDQVTGLTVVKAGTQLQPNMTYYWRVTNNAVPANLQAACRREVHSFATDNWQVVLGKPFGPGVHPWDLEFGWQQVPDATHYEFELYRGQDLQNDLEWQTTVSAPPYVLDVRINQDYYWRVRSVNSKGEVSPAWSPLQHFQTFIPSLALEAPQDWAQGGPELYPWGIELKWYPVKGADHYLLELTDYPECFVPNAKIDIQTFEPKDRIHMGNFQPTWDEPHLHCWRVTPVGPPLFDGSVMPEQGTVSDAWQIKTKDHETIPGSLAPMDRVINPQLSDDKAQYLLFPSVVGADKVKFQWQPVPHAAGYSVEVFPLMGVEYSLNGLLLLVGQLPPGTKSPYVPYWDPQEITAEPMALMQQYFAQDPNNLYGFWYRIVAHGPDGMKSPSPPWANKAAGPKLPTGEESFLVPVEYAPFAFQERPKNTGILLLRPTPVTILSLGQGAVWSDEVWGDGSWPGWELVAGNDGGKALWSPQWFYYTLLFSGPGCSGPSVQWYAMGLLDDELSHVTTMFQQGSAPQLSVSVRVRTNTGDPGLKDPGNLWASSPYAGLAEAAPFAVESQCMDITLEQPEDYGGDDGEDPPAEDPPSIAVPVLFYPDPDQGGCAIEGTSVVDPITGQATGMNSAAVWSDASVADQYVVKISIQGAEDGQPYSVTVASACYLSPKGDKRCRLFFNLIQQQIGQNFVDFYGIRVKAKNTQTNEESAWSEMGIITVYPSGTECKSVDPF